MCIAGYWLNFAAFDVSDGAHAIGAASCGDFINDNPRLRIGQLPAARGGQDTLFGDIRQLLRQKSMRRNEVPISQEILR